MTELLHSVSLQNRYIEGGDISFGPRNGSLAELAALEDLVTKLLSSEVYRSYDLDDWSLVLELSAYLCLPERRAMHELDFTVQVCCRMEHVMHAALL